MKKKLAIIFCMIASVLLLAGCGTEEKESVFTEDNVTSCAYDVLDYTEQFVEYGTGMDWDTFKQAYEVSYFLSSYTPVQFPYDYPYSVQEAAMTNYSNALKEMGTINIEQTEDSTAEVTFDDDEIIVKLNLTGENRDAQAEIIFTINEPTGLVVKSVAINPNYTFGEKMAKAGMNTLLGMGSVFCVLIIIIIVISLFGLLPKLTAKKDNKTKPDSVDNTIAQIIENEENLADDAELVAVIAAAIAAYEGTSGDGFVVRSINKRKRA